jgi:hypothetical protein
MKNFTITISRQPLSETYSLEDLGLDPTSHADEVAHALLLAEDYLWEVFCANLEITHTSTN